MNETEFMRHAVARLESKGFLVFPQNSHVSGTKRTRYKNGTPDLLAMSDQGQFYGIELKTETGKQKPSQVKIQDEFIKAGYADRYILCRPSTLENDIIGMSGDNESIIEHFLETHTTSDLIRVSGKSPSVINRFKRGYTLRDLTLAEIVESINNSRQ
jgi:hypothetical protein